MTIDSTDFFSLGLQKFIELRFFQKCVGVIIMECLLNKSLKRAAPVCISFILGCSVDLIHNISRPNNGMFKSNFLSCVVYKILLEQAY